MSNSHDTNLLYAALKISMAICEGKEVYHRNMKLFAVSVAHGGLVGFFDSNRGEIAEYVGICITGPVQIVEPTVVETLYEPPTKSTLAECNSDLA